MLAFVPPAFDGFLGLGRDAFSFQVVINLSVGDAEGDFISQAWSIFFQIGSWHLLIKGRVCTQDGQELLALALVEAEEGKDIRCPISKLGEEASDIFSCMVGSDDSTGMLGCDGILGNHALSGLDIALVEVGYDDTSFFQFGYLAFDCGLDVDSQADVRLDKIKGSLGIGFVRLNPIRKTDSDKLIISVPCLCSELLHGQLGQSASQGRVLTA